MIKKEYVWFIMGILITAILMLGAQMGKYEEMANFKDVAMKSYNHLNEVTSATAQDARVAREALPKLFNEISAINKQMETLSNNVYEQRRVLEDRINSLNNRIDMLRQQIQSESSYDTSAGYGPPTGSTGYTTGYPKY